MRVLLYRNIYVTDYKRLQKYRILLCSDEIMLLSYLVLFTAISYLHLVTNGQAELSSS